MEKPRVPLLKKIRGDDSIQCYIPIIDAQFLIGKSWDVSLKLDFAYVCDKHCTIEKIAADVWTLVSHENASVTINDHVLCCGYSRFLRCGDFFSLSMCITFQFKCSSLYCDNCNGEPRSENEVLDTEEHRPNREASSLPATFVYDQLLNHNCKLVDYLQSYRESAMQSNKESNKIHLPNSDRLELYKNLVDSYEQIFELEKNIERYKNLHMKVLVDIVTCQRDFIEKLQKQLGRMHSDFESIKGHSNQLEGINQHLHNENVSLRAKIAQYIENAETLRNENIDLQAEVVSLKAKQEKLMSTIDCKMKGTEKNNCVRGTSHLNEVGRNCEAVMEVKLKLTKLLETEFKCTICDEVFIEAVVTNCGHTFCKLCLSTWKVIKPNCPICRCVLTNETKALAVDSYLNNIMPFASDEMKNNWLKVVEERKGINSMLPKNAGRKRKYFFDDLLLGSINEAEFAVYQFYERFINSNFGERYFPVVDLTNDGAD